METKKVSKKASKKTEETPKSKYKLINGLRPLTTPVQLRAISKMGVDSLNELTEIANSILAKVNQAMVAHKDEEKAKLQKQMEELQKRMSALDAL